MSRSSCNRSASRSSVGKDVNDQTGNKLGIEGTPRGRGGSRHSTTLPTAEYSSLKKLHAGRTQSGKKKVTFTTPKKTGQRHIPKQLQLESEPEVTLDVASELHPSQPLEPPLRAASLPLTFESHYECTNADSVVLRPKLDPKSDPVLAAGIPTKVLVSTTAPESSEHFSAKDSATRKRGREDEGLEAETALKLKQELKVVDATVGAKALPKTATGAETIDRPAPSSLPPVVHTAAPQSHSTLPRLLLANPMTVEPEFLLDWGALQKQAGGSASNGRRGRPSNSDKFNSSSKWRLVDVQHISIDDQLRAGTPPHAIQQETSLLWSPSKILDLAGGGRHRPNGKEEATTKKMGVATVEALMNTPAPDPCKVYIFKAPNGAIDFFSFLPMKKEQTLDEAETEKSSPAPRSLESATTNLIRYIRQDVLNSVDEWDASSEVFIAAVLHRKGGSPGHSPTGVPTAPNGKNGSKTEDNCSARPAQLQADGPSLASTLGSVGTDFDPDIGPDIISAKPSCRPAPMMNQPRPTTASTATTTVITDLHDAAQSTKKALPNSANMKLKDNSSSVPTPVKPKLRIVSIAVVSQLSSAQRMHPIEAPKKAEDDVDGALGDFKLPSGTVKSAASNLLSDVQGIGCICGVQLIWTAEDYRKHHLASRLCDAARKHLVYGYEIPRDHCAFSQPTQDGCRFAQRFTGRTDFLTFW